MHNFFVSLVNTIIGVPIIQVGTHRPASSSSAHSGLLDVSPAWQHPLGQAAKRRSLETALETALEISVGAECLPLGR